MASNRERSLRAAIELLAAEGIRGLTHRRVDERAGLPEGSTSNAFRTREALLVGVTTHMVATELPAVTRQLMAGSLGDLADSLVAIFAEQVGPLRALTAARLALYVEAGHDEAVRHILDARRTEMLAPVGFAFAELGAPDPELAVRLLASCFQGLFLQVLGSDRPVEPRPIITAAVWAALRVA